MNLAICCLVKDTPEYLLNEFIKYHLSIGVDDIYFIVDINSKPLQIVVSPNIHVLYVEQFGNLKRMDDGLKYSYNRNLKQLQIYRFFYEMYKDKHDWIAFIDDDEFLHIDKNELEKYAAIGISGICIPWKIKVAKDICTCKNVFPCRFSDIPYNAFYNELKTRSIYKAIVNTHVCKQIETVHYGDTNCIDPCIGKVLFVGLNSENNPAYCPIFRTFTDEKILAFYNHLIQRDTWYIDHYFVRSFQEWLERTYERGDLVYTTDAKGNTRANRNLYDYYKFLDEQPDFNDVVSKIKQTGRIDLLCKIQDMITRNERTMYDL